MIILKISKNGQSIYSCDLGKKKSWNPMRGTTIIADQKKMVDSEEEEVQNMATKVNSSLISYRLMMNS